MARTSTPDPNSGWFDDDELQYIRQRLPLIYVEAVPVRVDSYSVITEVGLLLRGQPRRRDESHTGVRAGDVW